MSFKSVSGQAFVPRLQVKFPAAVHVNNIHDPPIEADGEVTCFSVTFIQFCCDQKLPIPSKGVIQFTLGNGHGELNLNVECVSRVELNKSFWSWRSQPKYEMRLALSGNSREMKNKYQDFIHRYIFGGSQSNSASTAEDSDPFSF